MSITVNCSIDLTEEELMYVLLSRAKLKAVPWPSPESAGAIIVGPGGVTKDEAGPSRLLEPVDGDHPNMTEERIEAVETVIAAALPPKPTRSRAKTNGTSGVNALAGQEAMQGVNSTPLAPPPPPEPEPLDEPAMRSLLSKVGAVHPLKVKAITDILENYGGARRLSECDPSTWPAIATAALVALKEHSA